MVIEHREALIYMICQAAEMEHALLCEYLFAAFSLKERRDEGLTAAQLFYQPDYLLPHHRAAWLLFAERLDDAASFARRLCDAGAPLAPIAAALGRHAHRVASAVPPRP